MSPNRTTDESEMKDFLQSEISDVQPNTTMGAHLSQPERGFFDKMVE